jgi:hypothetical protein
MLQRKAEEIVLDNIESFDQETFNEQTMKMICALRLPFRAVNNLEFKKWIRMASFAKSPPRILSPYDITKALAETAERSRSLMLARLPPSAKLSIALDTWQSPNKHGFLAITA